MSAELQQFTAFEQPTTLLGLYNLTRRGSALSTYSADGMAAKVKNMAQRAKPEIKVRVDTRKSYSTLDKLEGVVSITALSDTRFDTVEIDFVGTSKTFVERLTAAPSINGRSEAFHQFLKLSQPIPETSIPPLRTLEAGKTYDFPFLFVIPQQLLPRICQHRISSESVRDAHLQLPPTLGDHEIEGDVHSDDIAPWMAKISYAVLAKITRTKDDGQASVVAIKTQRVRIRPAMDEAAPLTVDHKHSDYHLRKEKNIKKGVFKGKLGVLVMEAAQPKSLRLQVPENDASTTTMVTVKLRFDPREESSQPPRLGSLVSKLKIATYFATKAFRNYPAKVDTMLDLAQGVHTEQLALSSRCVAGVEWRQRSVSAPQSPLRRRDSAVSTASMDESSTPQASERYNGRVFHTANILVPITLPSNKTFVPTFHSCLVSRTYSLTLQLSCNGVAGPTLELKVPVQVSAAASTEAVATAHQRVSLANIAEAATQEAEEFFHPRRLSPPGEELVGNSQLAQAAGEAPPDYSLFANTHRVSVFG
ncbi:hypothetical protein LTR50_002466 [Elasticomyces elasticus]|nr:hypothetical protein LTR50_002466 [Elasticomyces elasticus]